MTVLVATITLSHFSAALIFAFFASVVFGITQRNTQKEMVRYGLYCFSLFILGTIAAGSPIEAVENREELDLEQLFQSRAGVYVLRVRGDSMIDDHLCNGDYVVIERRENARNGEQVVALLDTGEATLKRYFKEGGKIRLQPANSTMAPRIVEADRMKIQGVVIGVLRTYHA